MYNQGLGQGNWTQQHQRNGPDETSRATYYHHQQQQQHQIRHQVVHSGTIASSGVSNDMVKTPYVPQAGGGGGGGGLPGTAAQPQPTLVQFQTQQALARQQQGANPSPAPQQQQQQQPQYFRSGPSPQHRQMQNLSQARPTLNHMSMMQPGSSPTQQGFYTHQGPSYIPASYPSQTMIQTAAAAQPQLVYQGHHQLHSSVEFQPSSLTTQHSSARYNLENGGDMNSAGMPYRYPPATHYQNHQNQQQLMYQQQQQQQQQAFPQMFLYQVPVAQSGRPPNVHLVSANMQPSQPQPPKREKKLLTISNPNTLEEVNLEELVGKGNSTQTPPMSGASSARDTPPMNQTPPPATSEVNDIAAQFARQVAAVASSVVPAVTTQTTTIEQLSAPVSVTQTQVTVEIHDSTVASDTEIKSEWTGQEVSESSAPITIVTKAVTTVEAPTPVVCHLPANVAIPTASVATEKVVVKAAPPPLLTTKTVVDPPLHVSNVGFVGYSGPMVDVAEQSRVTFMPHVVQAPPHHPTSPVVTVLSHPRSAPNSQDIVKHGGPPAMMVSPKGSRSEVSAPPPPFPPQKSEVMPSQPVTLSAPNESALPSVTSAPPTPQMVTVGQVPLLPPATQGVASFTVHSQLAAAAAAPPTPLVQPQPPLIATTPTHIPHVDVPSVQPPLIAKPPPHAHPQQKVVVSQPVTVQPSVAQSKQNGEMNTNTSDDVDGRDYETKDSKKTKGKKKSRDINKKGETKEGGDMDAFLDKEANSVAKVSSSASSTVTVAQMPSHDVETPPSVDVVVGGGGVEVTQEEEQITNDDGKAAAAEAAAEAAAAEELRNKEEQRKVVEKNEENAKVSASLIQNQEAPSEVIVPSDEMAAQTSAATSLKFEYKEDQWSPVNPEGKKQYDRSFLLQLQQEPMSQKKPEGLPDLEVIKDAMGNANVGSKPREYRMGGGSGPVMPGMQMKNRPAGNFNDFTPNYFSQTTSRPPMRGRSSQQGRKETPQKKINITLSLNQDVKLHEANDAWKPTRKVDKDLDPEEEKTEKLYKTFRGILNKLTPQNFPVLLEQVNSLPIDNELRLSGVINLVFEKAIYEQSFSTFYAQMCKTLGQLKVPSKQTTDVDVTYVNFRKLILTRCQKEFEKDTSDEVMRDKRLKQIKHAKTEEQKKELMAELQEDESKSKTRSLGNIRFIGELFKLRMLTLNIMHDCLQKLINGGDEDSLECLCKLLTTIGKDLDYPPQPSNNNRRNHDRDQRMNSYFSKMRETVRKQQHLSSRVRFMLQDVIDLRECNWVPRREDNNPKTLDQIHQEVAKEEMDKLTFLQAPMPPQKRMDDRDRDRQDRRGGGGGGGGVGNVGARRGMENDGWNTVASKQRTTPIVEGKTKITTVTYDEDTIQLGPKGAGSSWGRGSSGGIKNTPIQEQEKTFTPQNRFSALSNDGASRPPNTDTSRNSSRSLGGGSLSSSRDSSKSRGGPQLPPQASHGGHAYGGQTFTRSGVGPSRSREMEQAMTHVKNMNRSQSRDSSMNREVVVKKVQQPPPTSVEPVQVQVEFDRDAMDVKVKTIVDELIQNVDFKEAIQSVSELCTSNTVQYFVTAAINQTVERSSTARQNVGQLFSELVKREVMTIDRFSNGLAEILEVAEDYAIDIPKFWEYLAELLTPIVQDGRMPLRKLVDCSPLKRELIGQLLGNVLQKLVTCMADKAKVKDVWKNSGLQLSDVANDQQKFISQFKLDFLVQGDNSEFSSSNNRLLTDDELRKGLEIQLKLQSANEAMFDWVSAHVPESQRSKPPFIRALVTAIAESAIESKPNTTSCLDDKVFVSRCNLIKRYVDSTETLEMESLYALQVLNHRLEHPPQLLNQIFRALYENEVISEEAFLQWKNSDAHKYEGHAVAVKSVNAFLDLVMTQNPEDEDDEAD